MEESEPKQAASNGDGIASSSETPCKNANGERTSNETKTVAPPPCDDVSYEMTRETDGWAKAEIWKQESPPKEDSFAVISDEKYKAVSTRLDELIRLEEEAERKKSREFFFEWDDDEAPACMDPPNAASAFRAAKSPEKPPAAQSNPQDIGFGGVSNLPEWMTKGKDEGATLVSSATMSAQSTFTFMPEAPKDLSQAPVRESSGMNALSQTSKEKVQTPHVSKNNNESVAEQSTQSTECMWKLDPVEQAELMEESDAVIDVALYNYDLFYSLPRGTATRDIVSRSSAGVVGWANCLLENPVGAGNKRSRSNSNESVSIGDKKTKVGTVPNRTAHLSYVPRSDEEEARQLRIALLESIGVEVRPVGTARRYCMQNSVETEPQTDDEEDKDKKEGGGEAQSHEHSSDSEELCREDSSLDSEGLAEELDIKIGVTSPPLASEEEEEFVLVEDVPKVRVNQSSWQWKNMFQHLNNATKDNKNEGIKADSDSSSGEWSLVPENPTTAR